MNKPRLFVFGDSIATNYFSTSPEVVKDTNLHLGSKDVYEYAKEHNFYGHWLDLFGEHYEVTSYARGGVSIEETIYQLGDLPQYKKGDRMIIIITTAERYRWFYNDTTQDFVSGTPDIDKLYSSDIERELLKDQFVERTIAWEGDKQRMNEKKFLNNLPIIFKEYKPVIASWNIKMCEKLSNVSLFDIISNPLYTSITQESNGRYNDWHMGVKGNQHLYEFFKDKLNPKIL